MTKLYKCCQAAVFCLVLSLAPSLLFSQKRTLTQHPGVVVDQYIHGFYTSLPASYGTGSKQYPLLVMLHGIGEIGDGSASAMLPLLNTGPLKQVNLQVIQGLNANFPDPVTVNGKSFEFIIVEPQLNTWPPNGQEQLAVNDMINYAIQNYRVDQGKIYLTGLSMGGGIAWEYPGYSTTYGKRLAGLVPVAGASGPDQQRADSIAKAHVPVWATHFASDPTVPVSYTTGYIQMLQAAGANPAPLMTIFPLTGHGGWRQTYGDVGLPGCTNSAGQNIYQWMLQYRRSGDNVVLDAGSPVTFTVNAGPDMTITLPTNSVNITGVATVFGTNVASCKWTQVSGPSTAVISNSGTISPTVSSLIAGSYVFQVTLTSTSGLTTSDQMKVTVNSASGSTFTVSAGPDITIILPANSVTVTGVATVINDTVATCKWTEISGPSTAVISSGGSISPTMSALIQGSYVFQVALTSKSGKNVSDQMKVTVNPLTTGTFVVSAGPDVSITLPTNSWKIEGVATVKGVTPASCNWKEISGPSTATINGSGSITPTVNNLIAGAYVFEVDLVSTTGLTSTDQMKLTVNTATGAAASVDAFGIPRDSLENPEPSLKLYPNPVLADQEFAVEGQGQKAGTVKFMVYDRSGRLVKEVMLENQSSYFRQTIPVTGLAKGTYILTVTTAGQRLKTFKFFIQ